MQLRLTSLKVLSHSAHMHQFTSERCHKRANYIEKLRLAPSLHTPYGESEITILETYVTRRTDTGIYGLLRGLSSAGVVGTRISQCAFLQCNTVSIQFGTVLGLCCGMSTCDWCLGGDFNSCGATFGSTCGCRCLGGDFNSCASNDMVSHALA